MGSGFQPKSGEQCSLRGPQIAGASLAVADGNVVSSARALSTYARQASHAFARRFRAIVPQRRAKNENRGNRLVAFWQALGQQDPTLRDRWLARWVFADDTVKLSLRPEREKKR
jgi:hypothetical protein